MPYLLQQLLQISAKNYPNKEAVVYENISMTYGELNKVSDRLASVLMNCGITRGDRVGIYLDKSIEAVIAIFGILKVGAVYVPLDPLAPCKRIAGIIDNCQMKGLVSVSKKVSNLKLSDTTSVECIILANNELSEELGDYSSIKVVPWNTVLQAPSNPLLTTNVLEEDLAYILYTSGSTGIPKGVMISHRAALSFVNWTYDCFEVNVSDRVSNHAPLHFDLSIFDIFTTIKAGGTIILVPQKLSVFPKNLAKFIEEQQITIWYSVPFALKQLVLYGNLHPEQFSHLRIVLFAGEVFPIKYLRQLMKLVPQAKYYNLYGPTEIIICTYYPVGEIAPDRIQPLPIGKACTNTEVFAVNERQEIAKPGEVGELYARGSSLMKGYWGLPEKTRSVLAPFPASGSSLEDKVYRTGDLVRLDFDGNYIYLGRRDNQIKSRGYRIELEEIETTLYAHPAVQEAAVIAIPDEEIGNKIKAVVATHNGNTLKESDLKYMCAQHLPKYMIPEQIEFRSELPKTSTGKIDKNLLRTEKLQENLV